jgi:hypothetical protein
VKEKIKIGVLIKNQEVLLWEYRIIEKLLSSGFAEIKLLIKRDEDPAASDKINHSAIFRLHEKLDRFIFKNEFDYEKKMNISTLVKDVPIISYDPARENSGDAIPGRIYNRITDYNIDLILNFGNGSFSNDIAKFSRYGIWSYNAGDSRIIRGIPPVYWEIVKRMPEIGSTVSMALAESKGETVIYRTSISTFTRSININRNRIYGLASLVIPRLVKGLYLSGNEYLTKSASKYNSDIEIYDSEFYNPPASLQALWNLVVILVNHFYRRIVYKKEEFWFILYKIHENSKLFPGALESYIKVPAPKGKFWADPFVVSRDNHFFIFVEEYICKTGKAHISVLKLNGNGNLLSSEKIIERPYHMSYPFIFELDGKYYMIPESKGNGTIQLFCCTSFPGKWEFVMNLMENISATDSTLFYHNEKWWLFTAVDELNSPSVPFSELFLYFSDDLFSGHWQSHPLNPVITDIKVSRPAGRIFILNDKLYRPSQDCSGDYGKAFNLNHITKLSTDEYEEILISKVEPHWDRTLVGTHTFNFDDNICVIDASPLRRRI